MTGFVRTETCPDETTAKARAAALSTMGFDVTVKQGVAGTATLVDVDVETVDEIRETVGITRAAPWLVFAVLRG